MVERVGVVCCSVYNGYDEIDGFGLRWKSIYRLISGVEYRGL